MFSHVMIGADDVGKAKIFYDAILGELGLDPGFVDDSGRVIYRTNTGIFIVTVPINGQPASPANGGTLGFSAESPEQCDSWYKAGLENGGVAVEDPPGVREGSGMKMYIAYLRDPAGNKICALHGMASD